MASPRGLGVSEDDSWFPGGCFKHVSTLEMVQHHFTAFFWSSRVTGPAETQGRGIDVPVPWEQ